MLICITGPECSGKTTLASFIAKELDVAAVEEYARQYLEATNGQYKFADLDIIAEGQVNLVHRPGSRIGNNVYPTADSKSNKNTRSTQASYNQVESRTEPHGSRLEHAENIVVTDTFLLVILIWSLHKYGKVSERVSTLYSKIQPDLYLLCRPDLPWKQDAFRESPHERDDLFEKYLEQIILTDIPFFIVEGMGQERMQRALKSTLTLIQKKLP